MRLKAMIRYTNLALLAASVTAPSLSIAQSCRMLFSESRRLSPSLREAFYEAYSMERVIYRPGQCGRNVKDLALHLLGRGVDLSEARVLFLLHERKQAVMGGAILPGQLEPSFNRRHRKAWDFHVVLRVSEPVTGEPLILDLDWKPVPTSMHRYFHKLFPSEGGQNRLSNIALREIDLESYLHAFEEFHRNTPPHRTRDENYVVGDFRNPDLPQYPVTTVSRYLEQWASPEGTD